MTGSNYCHSHSHLAVDQTRLACTGSFQAQWRTGKKSCSAAHNYDAQAPSGEYRCGLAFGRLLSIYSRPNRGRRLVKTLTTFWSGTALSCLIRRGRRPSPNEPLACLHEQFMDVDNPVRVKSLTEPDARALGPEETIVVSSATTGRRRSIPSTISSSP
jgi:hypothetical protein